MCVYIDRVLELMFLSCSSQYCIWLTSRSIWATFQFLNLLNGKISFSSVALSSHQSSFALSLHRVYVLVIIVYYFTLASDFAPYYIAFGAKELKKE